MRIQSSGEVVLVVFRSYGNANENAIFSAIEEQTGIRVCRPSATNNGHDALSYSFQNNRIVGHHIWSDHDCKIYNKNPVQKCIKYHFIGGGTVSERLKRKIIVAKQKRFLAKKLVVRKSFRLVMNVQYFNTEKSICVN